MCICLYVPDMVLQLNHLAIWGSIACWFLFLVVYSHFYPDMRMAPEMLGMVCTVSSCVFVMSDFCLFV